MPEFGFCTFVSDFGFWPLVVDFGFETLGFFFDTSARFFISILVVSISLYSLDSSFSSRYL